MSKIKPRGVVATNRWLRQQVRNGAPFGIGLCKRKCREAYLVPSNGAVDAREAYGRLEHRFTGAWVWGAFIWFKIGEHWHVAICGFVKGVIFTTDNPRNGRWNRTTLEDFYARWPEAKFLAFSLDIDGVQVRAMPSKPRKWTP